VSDQPTPAPARPHLYFAYGSNLNVGDLLLRAPNAVRDLPARLEDWRLTFRGVANIEPAEGRTVFGGLWWLSRADVRALDRYEGFPSFYRRELVSVETDEGPRRAMTYLMGTAYEGYVGLPSPVYFDSIARGYADWGLPLSQLHLALRETREGHPEAVHAYRADGPKRLRAVGG
jgi:hypothetical protein